MRIVKMEFDRFEIVEIECGGKEIRAVEVLST